MSFSRSPYFSKWSGATWAVIGDSITEHNSKTTENYQDYIAQKIGCTSLDYGISGTGWRTPSAYGGSNAIYNRTSSIDASADLISVFAGTNDWAEVGIGMDLGSFGDTSASVSFYGAVDQTLDALVTQSPLAKIVVFTPLQRTNAWYNLPFSVSAAWTASTAESVGNLVVPTTANGYCYVCSTAGTTGTTQPTWPTTSGSTVIDGTAVWTYYAANPSGVSLGQISQAITQVANKYNVPVLDLYENGNFYSQNSTFTANFQPDGLHPNAAGHLFLSEKILAFLNTV